MGIWESIFWLHALTLPKLSVHPKPDKIVFKSAAKAFLSLSGTYFKVFLTGWIIYLRYSAFGKVRRDYWITAHTNSFFLNIKSYLVQCRKKLSLSTDIFSHSLYSFNLEKAFFTPFNILCPTLNTFFTVFFAKFPIFFAHEYILSPSVLPAE